MLTIKLFNCTTVHAVSLRKVQKHCRETRNITYSIRDVLIEKRSFGFAEATRRAMATFLRFIRASIAFVRCCPFSLEVRMVLTSMHHIVSLRPNLVPKKTTRNMFANQSQKPTCSGVAAFPCQATRCTSVTGFWQQRHARHTCCVTHPPTSIVEHLFESSRNICRSVCVTETISLFTWYVCAWSSTDCLLQKHTNTQKSTRAFVVTSRSDDDPIDDGHPGRDAPETEA